MINNIKNVLIRGGGDLATAVIQKLNRSGFNVVVSEIESPKMVRRTVSFSNAVYEGDFVVEGLTSTYCRTPQDIISVLEAGKIPVLTCGEEAIEAVYRVDVFVDATLSKHKVDYTVEKAPIVIGLGPDIEAGVNAHFVIETARGHNLGRIITEGFAEPNSSTPGTIEGFTTERVLRAPCSGVLKTFFEIGDVVKANDVVMMVGDCPVVSQINGVIRGLIHKNVTIYEGLKIGDVDPRGNVANCHTISEKGRNIAGGVLEAILWRSNVLGR